MANKMQFGLEFKLDKQGLSQAKIELEKIKRQLEDESKLKISGEELVKLRKQVDDFDKSLDKAFDKDFSKLNLNKLNLELKKANIEMDDFVRSMSKAGISGYEVFNGLQNDILKTGTELRKTKGIVDDMADTLVKSAKWSFASSAVQTFAGSIDRAIGYVKGLDNSLNNIRVVTGKSADEMRVFREEANQAAKELGKTTKEYADASLIFFQQGKTASEVKSLTQATLIGANITGEDVADMADYLTAVMNGYVLEANKALEITDKLAAVGAATGSDFGELAIGMSKVASAAKVMGVNVDQLGAMLATITTVTREAPETIGTTLKTIFTRMSELKAGKEDEEGWTTGKVEEALNKINVSVIDEQTNSMREMGEVMEEVGELWPTLNKESKIGVSVAMAGTRQASRLMALFENWQMYSDALTTSLEAQGSSMEQNLVRMDSMEYKSKQLRAQAEELWNNIFDEDIMIGITEAMTGALGLLNDFIEGFGGIENALTSLSGIAVTVFSKNISQSIVSAEQTFRRFRDSLKKVPEMNLGEMATSESISKNLELGKINEKQASSLNSLLQDKVKLRQQEEFVQKNLNEHEVTQYQKIKEQIMAEREKLSVMEMQRLQDAEMAKKDLTKDNYASLTELNDKEMLLALDEELTFELKEQNEEYNKMYRDMQAIQKLKESGYSADSLTRVAIANKETLRLREQEIQALLKRNRYNEDAIDIQEELNRMIDEIDDNLMEQSNILDDIEKKRRQVYEIQNEEVMSEEEIVSSETIAGLENQAVAYEKQAKRTMDLQKAIVLLGATAQAFSAIQVFAQLNNESLTAEERINILSTGMTQLSGIAFSLIPLLGPGAGVAGAALALLGVVIKLANEFNPLNRAIKENKRVLEEQNKAIQESRNSLNELKGSQSAFIELQKAMTVAVSETGEALYASIADLDTKEYSKYVELSNQIASVAPQLVSYYDELGNAVIDLNGNYADLIKQQEENIRVANAAKRANAEGFAKEYNQTISDLEMKIKANKNIIEQLSSGQEYAGYDAFDIGTLSAEITKMQGEIQKTQGEIYTNIIDPIFSGSEAYSELTKRNQEYVRNLVSTEKISQKISDPKELKIYTNSIEKYIEAVQRKNQDLVKNIEDTEMKISQIMEGGVEDKEQQSYNELKETLEDLNKQITSVSNNFDNLSLVNQQNVLETSGLIKGQIEDYDGLIDKLSQYYNDSKNLVTPMTAGDLTDFSGGINADERIQNLKQQMEEIDSSLLELADKEGELMIARENLKDASITPQGSIPEEINQQLIKYNEQIYAIQDQENELLEAREQRIEQQILAHAAMIEEAQLQQELNDLFDKQLLSMVETTEGYNEIAEVVNNLLEPLENFKNLQAESQVSSSEDMDAYVNSLVQYSDLIPGLSEAIDDYRQNGTSSFAEVSRVATEGFSQIEQQANKMYLALNKDNSDFYKKFLTDNKNLTNLAEIEYGVRAQNYRTYAEYEKALDDAKKRGKIKNLTDEQRELIKNLDENQTAYLNYNTNQLEISNSLKDAENQNTKNKTQNALSAYKTMTKAGVSVADSLKYAFLVMVDKISGSWANMANSLIDVLNGMLRAGGGFVNGFIDMLNKIPGVDIGNVNWGNIDHISGSKYASDFADEIKDKYTEPDYEWEVDKDTTQLKPPSTNKPGFGGGTDSDKDGGMGPGVDSGGGKDKDKKEKEVKDLEWEEDIYHDINVQIERKSKLLSILQKQQNKLYGKELLDNLQKQKSLLEEQQKLQEKKLAMQKQEASDLAKKLGTEVKINKDTGFIENYNEVIKKKVAEANAKSGEAKEQAIKDAQDFIKLMDKYEDLVNNTIWDTNEQIQELIDQQREIFLQEFEFEINAKLEISEDLEKSLEFLKQFNDEFDETDERYQNTADLLNNKMSDMQSITEQLEKIKKDTSLTEKERLELTQKYTEELMNATTEADKLRKELDKIVEESLKQGLDLIQEHLKEYERIDKQLKHIETTLELIGEGNNFAAIDDLYEAQYKNIQGQIDVLLKQKQALISQRDTFEKGSKEWKLFNDKIVETENSINSLVQNGLKVLESEFKNSINSILKDLDKALSSGLGLDKLKEDFDQIKKNRKEYLDIEEKITESAKLQKKIEDAMKNTNDPKQLEALKKFKDKELAALKEKDKLTKYDLDRANKLFDLTLKQIALDEQRYAKNIMRLVRDAQGNWVYEFVEDSEAIKKAQEELSKDLEALQQMDKEQMQKTQEEMLKEKEDYLKKVQNIIKKQQNGEYNSEEEFRQALIDAENDFTKRMAELKERLTDAQNNMTTSSLATILQAYLESDDALGILSKDQEATMELLAKAIGGDFTKLSDLMSALNSGNTKDFNAMADSMGIKGEDLKKALTSMIGKVQEDWGGATGDMIGDIGSVAGATDQAVSDIMDKWNEYQEKIKDITENTQNDLGGLMDKIGEVSTSTDILNNATDDLINKFTEQMNVLNEVIKKNDSVRDSYDSVIDSVVKYINTLRQAMITEKELANKLTPGSLGTAPEYKPEGGYTGKGPTETGGDVNKTPQTEKKPIKGGKVKVKNMAAQAWYDSTNNRPVPFWEKQAKAIGVAWDSIMYAVNSANGKMALSKTNDINGAIAWVKSEDLIGLRTGGYTGNFSNSQEGRIAVLHEKEIVLNQSDTSNLLDAVKILRNINLDSIIQNVLQKATSGVLSAIGSLGNSLNLKSNSYVSKNEDNSISQEININADFSGVKNSAEIEKAFESLVVQAAQYASKRK